MHKIKKQNQKDLKHPEGRKKENLKLKKKKNTQKKHNNPKKAPTKTTNQIKKCFYTNHKGKEK